MAIGTITLGQEAGQMPSAPLFGDIISFAGDSSYPTGGTADFEGSFQAKRESRRTVLAVVPLSCGGYVPVYDHTNDKLMVYYGNYDAADGPLIEVPNATNLSGTTFKVLVISC